MRSLVQVLVAFVLISVVGAAWRVTPFTVVMPDVALVFALYLGVSAGRSALWEATLAAIVIGYLHDVLAGGPRGAGALVLGAVCILCRVASARLLLRGGLFIATFTFLGAVAAACAGLLVRLYYGVQVGPFGPRLVVALGSALLTAAVAPWIFRLCRGIDARFARTQREREAVREGYLT